MSSQTEYGDLRQFVNLRKTSGGRSWYYLRPEDGFTAYSYSESNAFQEVGVRGVGWDGAAGSVLAWTWSFPVADGTKPTLVSVEKDRYAPQDSFTVEAGVGTVEVRYEVLSDKVRLSINGQHVKDLSRDFLQVPGFRSPYSGSYSITSTIARTGYPPSQATYQYKQKALRFLEEFPVYDLQSSEPVHITNSFGWDDGSPVEAAYWQVTVDGSEVKAGLSTEISAVWSPTDGILARAAGPGQGPVSLAPGVRAQGAFQTLPYEVRASAVAFQRGGINEIPYEISSNGSVPGLKELRIVDERITPDPPFEEPDSSVTLTAKVIAIALEIDPETVEWTVDLKDQDGATVVEDLAVGTGPDVSAVWDGKINGQAMPNPTFYKFKITATACEGGIVVGGRAVRGQDTEIPEECPVAQEEVEMERPLQLTVWQGQDKLALGLPLEEKNQDNLKEAYKLFSNVHRTGAEPTLDFEVTGLPIDTPSPVTLSVSSVTTGKALPNDVVLADQGDGTYTGSVTMPAGFLLPRENPRNAGNVEIKTPFSMGYIAKEIYNVSTDFESQVAPRYPQASLALGRFSLFDYWELNGAIFPHVSTQPSNGAAATVANLQTLGFEILLARLNVEAAPLEAYIKVASPSRVALLNFHGDYSDGSLSVLDDQFQGGATFLPGNLQASYSGNLDTLIFAACDVLDINDYNNFRYRQVLTASGEMGWLPQAARENAGLKWFTELIVNSGSGRPTGRPAQVLLGYNGPAPVWAVANVMEEYGRQLQVFQGAANAQQMAWMTANLIVGQNPAFGTPESPSSLAMQACAIDEERYYYIPFKYNPNEGTDEWQPPYPHSIQGIYWVERSRWDETPEDWDANFRPATTSGGLGLAQKARRL